VIRDRFRALLGIVCVAALGADAGEVAWPFPPADRVMVRLADGVPLPVIAGAPAAELDEIVTREPLRAILRVRSGSPTDALRLTAALAAVSGVQYAVAERFLPMELRSRPPPNDPLFAEQWALDNRGQGGEPREAAVRADVGALEAWSYTQGSPDVLIAVLDDGVQLDHPDLAPNIAGSGRDFSAAAAVTAAPRTSADRHGTSVAGVAAARGGNGIGVSGICPYCRILPIRVSGSSNFGTAAAFRYAVEQGADIITNSWGYTRAVPYAADAAVRDAIDSAARDGRDGRGALVVFGVTNEPIDNCGEGGDISSLDSVLAVGVSNHRDEVGGSGFGPCMDLVAPSKPRDRDTIGIVTTDRTGLDGHTAEDYFSSFGGTSAAAPLVAGIAGLLLSLNPALGRADLQRILEHTAEQIDVAHAAYDAAGFSARAGHGRVSAARALVPTVKIEVTPAVVPAGEPFSITVTTSAPFGVESVWWFGQGTGFPELDAPHVRMLDGEYVRAVTWDGISMNAPGEYSFGADARDRANAAAPEGYPHRAGERSPAPLAHLTVVERANAFSR
jgi:subtilisin family serine protease